ncbi:MAG: hypothetical protein JXR41_07930, partial [Bacteroidales bacterium]|nr:hypothetical protein [Bacteroidales bacterium]
TGEVPFSVTYLRNGTNARTINNIRQHDYMLKVVGNGTYTLSAVTDQVRTGCVSGTGTVVYYPIPTASISGSGSICEHNSKNLMVAFTGTAPWNFSYHRNDEVPVSINNITAPSHSINVKLEGSYTLVNVSDHYCNGTVSGNAVVTVTPAPEVTITGLSPAYSYQDMSMIPVFGEPESGTFMPPLVEIRDTNYFLPYLAGIGIHTIVYSYRDVVTGCFGYDTAIIAVLAADADIIFPDNDTKKFFCFNDAPFILHGHNTKNSIGTFTISGGAGLADNHDNTATVYPSQLKSGTYQVTYKYFNETWLEVKESFEVEYVSELRFIGFDRTAYCDNEDRISLNGNIAGGVFSGRAVTGNVTTGFNFEPKLAYAGPDTVFYTLTTARGCSRQIFKHLIIRDAPNINFTVDDTCFSSSAADSTSFINLTTSTDTVRSWLWTFGDATSQNDSSTLMNPKHKYTRDGTKRITLKANTDFCENSGSIIFNFGRKPIADFDWSSECFHEGQGIRFINKSSSVDPVIIDGYKWKFHTGEKYDSLSSRDAEYVYSDTGNYKVELFIHSNFGCTDKRIKTLPLRPTYQMAEGASYFEGFENGMAGWLSTSENTVNSWRMDTPADAPGEGFVGAAKGDYAWYTNITVDNAGTAPREQSAVTSPCFDFSGIHKPMIRFDLWRWFNNNLNDGAVMQYKADTGTAWKNVGDLHDGISWYLDHKISGNPGGQPIGWSKTSNDAMWNEARHSLDELKNKTDVQFRIAYGSDSTARETHGMAFDNIWIGERNRIILIEHFTNSGDLDSKAADSSLDALANSNPYDIVDIQYHTSFPGTDPFNQQNKVDPGTRVLYYQLSSVPVSIVNGGADDDFIFDYDGNDLKPLLVKNQSLTTPKFSLSLETSMTDNALNINAELRPLESVINEQITLHIAVIERKITGITGANGDTLFESVLKTILSSTSYTNNWDPAVDFKTVTKSWNYKNAYNADEIRVIAFVQNEASKEIYQ